MSYADPGSGQFHHRPSGSYDFNSATPPPPPPKPGSGTQTPSRGQPPPPLPQGHVAPDPSQYDYSYSSGAQSFQPISPPETGWLPAGLVDKTTQDLHYLLEHQDLQTAFLDNSETSHPSIAQAQAPVLQLLESNIALSESLLQLEAQLVALRSSTQSRLLGLRALEQQHRTKIAETETELKGFSPMALYQRLNGSIQEQDSLLKGIEESFLDESGMATDKEVQEFVRRLREVKKTSFLKNERKMRWDEGRVGGWR